MALLLSPNQTGFLLFNDRNLFILSFVKWLLYNVSVFYTICSQFSIYQRKDSARCFVHDIQSLGYASSENRFSVTTQLCFGSLVILDVACCYLWLFSLYINIKIGRNNC